MFYSFKRGTKVMAVERSAAGRERKKARDAFSPCCSLLYPRSVICSSSQASLCSPWDLVLQSRRNQFCCQVKDFWVGSKKPCCPPSSQLMSRESNLFPSLAASKYCMYSCLRVRNVIQYGSCGKIRILYHIYYICNFELLKNVIIKS